MLKLFFVTICLSFIVNTDSLKKTGCNIIYYEFIRTLELPHLQENLFELERDIIVEVLEDIDGYFRNSEDRKKSWDIVRKDENSILTSFVSIRYNCLLAFSDLHQLYKVI